MGKKIDTEYGNKLIAEFMGVTIFEKFWGDQNDKELHADSEKLPINTGYGSIRAVDLEYNSNWNWLMPVVKEINKIKVLRKPIEDAGEDREIISTIYKANRIYRLNISSPISTVYDCVVRFIEWNNEDNKNGKGRMY